MSHNNNNNKNNYDDNNKDNYKNDNSNNSRNNNNTKRGAICFGYQILAFATLPRIIESYGPEFTIYWLHPAPSNDVTHRLFSVSLMDVVVVYGGYKDDGNGNNDGEP